MKKNEVARKALVEEYQKLGGMVFANFMMRTMAGDEGKKSIQAADFMKNLLEGKSIKKEWNLEEDENFVKMMNLVDTINLLAPK